MATDLSSPSLGLARQRWFLLGLLLLFVVLSVQYSVKVMQSRSAINRWRDQILVLDAGDNPYDLYNYPNPPIMAILLTPIAKLPPLAGALTWFYLKVAMTLLALALVFRLIETAAHPFPPWAKAVTVLLSLRPILGDLSHGNVNLFILLLVVGALYLYHHGRDLLGGVVLALSIACKVTPALFVGYFLWKRGWKTLLGVVVGLGLFLYLVPGLVLGMAENATLLASWSDVMLTPFLVGGVVTSEHNNQSLPGLLTRLLTHSPSFSDYIDDQYTPLAYHNVLSLSPAVVGWLVKGCMGLFVLLVVWVCRTPTQPRQSWRLAAEFSLIVLGMLLFSERTWKHHCVTLVLPFGVLTYYLATCRPAVWLRNYLIATLAAVTLLMALTSVPVPAWHDSAKIVQTYGAYVWGYLLLTAALAVILKRPAAANDWSPEAGAIT